MPRLVTLGDSFAHLSGDARSYQHIVATRLNLDLSDHNPARGASSLDHMFMRQWPDVVRLLDRGDLLIVCLTNPDRTFFFPRDHMLSMPDCLDEEWMSNRPGFEHGLSGGERDALRGYYSYLHSDERNLRWLDSWFHHLDRVCTDRAVRAVVMDGMDSGTAAVALPDGSGVIRSTGYLADVSMSELADAATHRYISEKVDPRINHMMLVNHGVLAEKICGALEGEPLDLCHGFHAGCFDISRMSDRSWFADSVGHSHMGDIIMREAIGHGKSMG